MSYFLSIMLPRNYKAQLPDDFPDCSKALTPETSSINFKQTGQSNCEAKTKEICHIVSKKV